MLGEYNPVAYVNVEYAPAALQAAQECEALQVQYQTLLE